MLKYCRKDQRKRVVRFMEQNQLLGYLKHGWRFTRAFLEWLVLGTVVGLIVGAVSSCFGHALVYVNELRGAYPLLKLGLPAGGLAIVFLYRFFKNHSDKGTNTVIASVRSDTDVPFKMAPLIFVTTTITHLFGGSAGREGAALQLGGSIANKLGKLFNLDEHEQHTIIMCGMSAGFSALFGTPMAAAVFSMEVVRVGTMQYSAFVPCVVASMTAHFVAMFFQIPPETFLFSGVPEIDPYTFLQMLLFAAATALVSILFCVALHESEHLYERHLKNPYARIFVGGVLVVGLTFLVGTDAYLGSGMGIIEDIFHHGGNVEWYSFLLKMVFTALTIGAGFKGGEIVPSFTIGACFGSCAASLMGLPVELVTACGMIGVFCGVTNSPITALLIAFELFGFEGMPYFLVTVAVTYMLSGYHSLYREQRFENSKTESDGRAGIPD